VNQLARNEDKYEKIVEYEHTKLCNNLLALHVNLHT
jgi:hypothetical protein